MKKKVLLIYYEMMLGGSTTSLLSFMNCIDTDKYEVDLQLYRNVGELYDLIPEHINVLPEAFMYGGKLGNIAKKAKLLLTGYYFKAKKANREIGKTGFSGQVMAEFQAKHLSRKINKHYDYAIGFIEGWSDRYLAYCVEADKKYGWIHNTFLNVAPIAKEEYPWINAVDKVVFVAQDCTEDFIKIAPQYKDKAITIENLFDSEIIRKRAMKIDSQDEDYKTFVDDKRFKIVTVCRLAIAHKGLDRIVNCAKELKNSGYSFVWYIIGEGVDREQVEKFIIEADVKDRVILLGMKKNPYPYIVKSDLMCMPSRWEGKPMVVTEAQILGIPTVVTEYLSAREQILDGTEGIVVENSETSVIPVLKDLLDHPEKCSEMREYLLAHEYGNAVYMREIEKMLL